MNTFSILPMKNNKILDIISKYFKNEATDDEVEVLNNWCAESNENKQEFIRLKKIWILSNEKINRKILQSKPKVWNNIYKETLLKTAKKYTRKQLMIYLSIASSIAILLTVSVTAIINSTNTSLSQYTEMCVAKGEKGQIFLPDGTRVWLNSGSKIVTDNFFNTKNRIVKLEGEAYFDVAKGQKHNFIVESGGIDVVVYGTAFKVTAYPESSEVRVALQRGKVNVLRHSDKSLLHKLSPNQEIILNKNSYQSDLYNFDADNFISWTFDELIFDYASIDEVFSKMENWYGVNIHVEYPHENLKYRFKIKTETLPEVLSLLNKMAPIEYTINGKEVTIKYK